MVPPTETPAPIASARKALHRYALPIGAFLVAASFLALAAHRFHQEQVAAVRANAANELLAVTDLKVEQMVAYHRERLANAASLHLNVLVARGIEDLLRGDLSPADRQGVADWLSAAATHYRYSRVTLASADGTILTQSPLSTRARLEPETIPAAQRAFESRSPMVWRGDADHTTMFHILVPLFRPADGKPLAVVVLEADVAGTIAAATYWPVPRRTAAMWFLVDCPEHGRPEISTSLQGDPHVRSYAVGDATVRALLRRPGVVQTVTEGRRRVLAVVAAVPATPWTLVAQIDEEEVLELARARSLASALVAGLLISVLAAGTALWVRRSSRSARRREAALRSELDGVRQQFVVVSDMLNDTVGSALLDRDAHVVEANPALAEILGRPRQDVVGRSLIGLSCTDDQPRATVLFGELLAGKRDHYRDERKFVRPDGGVAHVVLRVSAIRDGDQLQVALALVEDVTELKSLQAQLTQADRMASVGTLAAGVAHEINNPLAFVLANVGYAEEELARPVHDAGEVRKALAEAHEGARRVRQIVLDLKTFAREDERAAGSTDVTEAIRFALSLVHNELRHRARLEVDVGALPPVQGAEHRVGQVLVNLLVNAVHALPPDRTAENVITISARRTDDGHVDVAVGDNGAGIAPDVLPRIFDPFFTTKPVGSGTGLGLAICHGIVAQLGGRMTVESELGAGSTFHVMLPAALEPANDPAEPGPGAALSVHARVLVVDDEPLVASSVARVLGYRCAVEAVTDARGALERLAASRFDVILCDLMMPNFSGAEFYRVLSATVPALAARTVFLTGGAFTPDAEAFLERERPPVLAKPFEPDQLRSAVAAALGGRREDAAA